MVNYVSEGSKSKAEQVAADIQAVGSKASVCQASVSTMEDIPKLIEAAVALSPNNKINILVHKLIILSMERCRLLTTMIQCGTRSRSRY